MQASQPAGFSPKQLVALVCAAQVLVQIGAFFWPALLPRLAPLWGLSNSEAGWVTAAFYGAYILAVPVLVTLTDRVDAKRVYLVGVALTIAGHGLFGLLADGFWSAVILTVYAIDFLSKRLRERIIGDERRRPVADDQSQFSEPKAG